MSENNDIIAQGPGYSVRRGDVEVQAVRSSGPGGQNVNKVATKIVLHFNVRTAPGLSEYIRKRMLVLFANQITAHGDLVIVSSRTRSQQENRADAYAKLAGKLRQAAFRQRKRIKTSIPRGVHEKRLKSKKRRSEVKKSRRRVKFYD